MVTGYRYRQELGAISYQLSGDRIGYPWLQNGSKLLSLRRKIGNRVHAWGSLVGDYRKLKAWKKAHELAIWVYRATESFPSTERYGLVSQMRRAAISTASNIVEGVARNRRAETAYFIRVALGSCTELENQILLSKDLQFLETETASKLTERTMELRAMLASLYRRLLPSSADPDRVTTGHSDS